MPEASKVAVKRIKLTNTAVSSFACIPGTNCTDKARYALLFDSEFPRLALRATTAGAKSFIFLGYIDGRPCSVTIGDIKTLGIDDARARARKLQGMLDQGIDPREHERERKAASEAKKREAAEAAKAEELRKRFTLKALCDEYVEYLKAKGKHKTANDCLSAFRCHVYTSDYANKVANEVESEEIAEIVRKVYESGKVRTSGIVRSYLVAAYNIGRKASTRTKVQSSLIPFKIKINPADVVENNKTPPGIRHLSEPELFAYLNALTDSPNDLALKVAIYAGGQRMAQLVRAKVSDYSDGVLRLFDAKGKREQPREHLLPLAPVAQKIVDSLVADKPAEAYIFKASARTASNRLAEIRTENEWAYFDLKDIRRTCETMLARMGISKDIRAQLLSHGITGVQSVVYDKYDYIDEKKTTLLAWEARLTEIESGTPAKSNVVKLTA